MVLMLFREIHYAPAFALLAEKIAPDELLTWINQHVEARYQRVNTVLIQETFPRNAAGKTLKRVMRDTFWQGQAQ